MHFYGYCQWGTLTDQHLAGSANYGIEGHPAKWSNMIVLEDPYAITYKRYGWWIGLGVVVMILILMVLRKIKK